IGTIQNDDGAGATSFLSIDDVEVLEGASGTTPLTFHVTRSGSTSSSVSVSFATSPANATAGTDYQSLTGSVTFAIGESMKPVTVMVNGDGADEPNEAFVVTLSSPSAGAEIRDGLGQGTILDDDGRPALCRPVAIAPFVISSSGSYCLVRNLS